MKKTSVKILLLASLLVIGVCCSEKERLQLEQQCNKELLHIESLRQKQRELEDNKARLYRLQQNLRLLPQISRDDKTDQWQQDIQVAAVDLGIGDWRRIKPFAHDDSHWLSVRGFSLSFTATFDQLGALLARIESAETLYAVTSLRFSRQPRDTSGTGKVELSVMTFISSRANPLDETSEFLREFKPSPALVALIKQDRQRMRSEDWHWSKPRRDPFAPDQALRDGQPLSFTEKRRQQPVAANNEVEKRPRQRIPYVSVETVERGRRKLQHLIAERKKLEKMQIEQDHEKLQKLWQDMEQHHNIAKMHINIAQKLHQFAEAMDGSRIWLDNLELELADKPRKRNRRRPKRGEEKEETKRVLYQWHAKAICPDQALRVPIAFFERLQRSPFYEDVKSMKTPVFEKVEHPGVPDPVFRFPIDLVLQGQAP